jgi:DNA-binding transcriptional ArsR family regulator
VRWFLFSGLASIAARRAAAFALLAAAAFGAPGPPGELRDIAPPVEMPGDPVWPWYAAAGVFAAAAAGVGVYAVRRRRAAARAAAEAAALLPRPPHEEAMEALRLLARAAPASREQHAAFYTRLAEILRRYIARRFGVDAPEATSSELLAALRENGAVAEERHGLLRELFGESDLVKFAALVPPGDAPGRALERCRSFVRETAMEVEHAL